MNFTFSRIQRLPQYSFAAIADARNKLEQQGAEIIDMGMGNPDGVTPENIVKRAIEELPHVANHRYSETKGIRPLRESICNWYKRRYQVELDPDSQATMSIGSKEGLFHLALAGISPGDSLIVPNPCYPIHFYGPIIAGASVVQVAFGSLTEDEYIQALEKALRESVPTPVGIIVNFPNNPTGRCMSLDFFTKLVALAKAYKVWVIHDLAYADIVFEGTAPSILQAPGALEVAVEFFCLSKSYNMPGWRIGFCVGNQSIIHALVRLKSYGDYGTFAPLQHAAIEALDGEQSGRDEIVKLYKSRRDYFVKGLQDIGIEVEAPPAGMFIWVKTPPQFAHLNSVAYSQMLLEQCHLVTTPGSGFGTAGEGYTRFALIADEAKMRRALSNISQVMNTG